MRRERSQRGRIDEAKVVISAATYHGTLSGFVATDYFDDYCARGGVAFCKSIPIVGTHRLAQRQGEPSCELSLGLSLWAFCFSFAVSSCNDTSQTGTMDMNTPPPDQSTGLSVAAISPAGGINTGGTTITITGQGFQSGATVTVFGAPCQNVTVQSPTSLTCTTPAKAGTCGAAAVVVTNPDGKSVSRSDLFAYTSATLSFSPMNTISTGSLHALSRSMTGMAMESRSGGRAHRRQRSSQHPQRRRTRQLWRRQWNHRRHAAARHRVQGSKRRWQARPIVANQMSNNITVPWRTEPASALRPPNPEWAPGPGTGGRLTEFWIAQFDDMGDERFGQDRYGQGRKWSGHLCRESTWRVIRTDPRHRLRNGIFRGPGLWNCCSFR